MELKSSDMNRYNDYMSFLRENNANPEILALPGIQDIIAELIEYGDPRVKADGRSPIAYFEPNKDGTFPIGGRIAGPVTSVRYEMEYCNEEPDDFIKLTNRQVKREYSQPYDAFTDEDYTGHLTVSTTTIIIDKEGKIKTNKTEKQDIYDENEEQEELERGGMHK